LVDWNGNGNVDASTRVSLRKNDSNPFPSPYDDPNDWERVDPLFLDDADSLDGLVETEQKIGRPTPSEDAASDVVAVTTDLAIDLTPSVNPATVTLTIENKGDANALNTTAEAAIQGGVFGPLPAGRTAISPARTRCDPGTLDAQRFKSWVLPVVADPGNVTVNVTGVINTEMTDPTPTNNTKTITVQTTP
jgi:hypothetical protein